jgi:uncharacterized protein (DUF4415 family)
MTKRSIGSSVRGRRAGGNGGRTRPAPDADIDFSDIPELTDAQLRGMRRVGRPPLNGVAKQLIALRIHPTVLRALRAKAARRHTPYQTYIHEILERAARRQ